MEVKNRALVAWLENAHTVVRAITNEFDDADPKKLSPYDKFLEVGKTVFALSKDSKINDIIGMCLLVNI